MILLFDTETSGFPSNDLSSNHPGQAHIVQLACLLLDKDLNEQASLCTLVKPNGWKISSGAQAVHKKSLEMCEMFGIDTDNLSNIFQQFVHNSKYLVAHNLRFDKQMASIDMPLSLIEQKQEICTMHLTTDLCRIPHTKMKGHFKWPKLEEACQILLHEDIRAGAHDALADVRACAKLFRYLVTKDYVKL